MRRSIHAPGVGMRISSSISSGGRSPCQSWCATRYQPPTLPIVRDESVPTTFVKASSNWTLYQCPSIGGIQSTKGCAATSSHADETSTLGSGVARKEVACVASPPCIRWPISPRCADRSRASPWVWRYSAMESSSSGAP